MIRDKFLVMSTELQDDKSPSELAALWKTIPKTNIVEHRSDYSRLFLFTDFGRIYVGGGVTDFLLEPPLEHISGICIISLFFT